MNKIYNSLTGKIIRIVLYLVSLIFKVPVTRDPWRHTFKLRAIMEASVGKLLQE